MRIYELRISRVQISVWPENERRLFLILGNILNDMNVFSRLLLWNHNAIINLDDNPKERLPQKILRDGLTCQFFTYIFLYCSKSYEAWKAINKNYHSSPFKAEYTSNLSKDASEALTRLGTRFGKHGVIANIRNKAGFHYDKHFYSLNQESTFSNDDFVFYLSEENINALSNISSSILHLNILSNLGFSSNKESLDELLNLLLETISDLSEFISDAQRICLDRNCPEALTKLTDNPIDIACDNRLSEFRLPHFVEAK